MKTLTLKIAVILGCASFVLSGCKTPKPLPYWATNLELEADIVEVQNPNPVPNNFDPTNLVDFKLNVARAPENPLIFMIGNPDISKDIVKKSVTGETVRVHDDWVYRFYPGGGINSITKLSSDPSIRTEQIH